MMVMVADAAVAHADGRMLKMALLMVMMMTMMMTVTEHTETYTFPRCALSSKRTGLLCLQPSCSKAARHVRGPGLGMEVVSLASTKQLPIEDVFWQYEGDAGTWANMPQEFMEVYENAFRRSTEALPTYEYMMKFRGNRGWFSYVVDFSTMTQTNKTTGNMRRIRRLVAFS